MILIGLGANLSSPAGPPQRTLQAALAALESDEIHVLECSRFFESEPVPISDQPLFVNAVASVATTLSPEQLLTRLHAIEASFGRVRRERNEARTLDLDLLDYDGVIRSGGAGPILPHPRLDRRAFVLLPIAEFAADWRHPISHRSAAELLAGIPAGERMAVRPLGASAGSAKYP